MAQPDVDYMAQLASGQPAAASNPHDPRTDYTAAHNLAQQGSGDALERMANGGAPPPPSGADALAPPKPPPGPKSDLPVGQQIYNWMNMVSRAAYVPEGQRQDKTLWEALGNGIAGIPAEVGRQFTDALSQFRRDALPSNLQEVRDALSNPLPPGIQPGLDALNVAFAPLTGALTSGVGRPVEEATGVNRNLTGFLLSLMAPGGLGKAGKLLKGAKALEGVEGAETAAKAAEGAAAPPAEAQAAAAAAPAEGAPAAPPAEGAAAAPAEGGAGARMINPEYQKWQQGLSDYIEEKTGGKQDAYTPEMKAAYIGENGPKPPVYVARAAAEAPAAAAGLEVPPEGERPAPFSINGDQPKPDFKMTPDQEKAVDDFLNGKGLTPIGLTMDELSNPDQIGQIVTDIAKRMETAQIPINDDVVKMHAYTLGLNLTPDEIMAKRVMDPQALYTMMAQKSVLETAASELKKASDAAKATGDPAAYDTAKRYGVIFQKYVNDWYASGRQMGQTFRVRQVVAGTMGKMAQDMAEMIRLSGSDVPWEEIINKTADMRPENVSGFMSTLRNMTSRDGLLYGWYNWLLSNPAVIVKKGTSDSSLAVFNLATRYTAEKLGPAGAVAPGETAALFHGYISAWQEALQFAGKALRTGTGNFHAEFNSLEDGTSVNRISRLANGMPDFPADQVTRPALQYLRSAMPTTWIGAMDDFAKVFNYRAEVAAGAWRKAVGELGRNAKFEDLNQRAAELRNVVPQDLHEMAINRALRNTLQEPLSGPAATMQNWIDSLNIPLPNVGGLKHLEFPLGRFISPFTKISANVARFAYRSSPLPFVLPSALWKEEMAAGGARKALAQAQAGLGTGVTLAALPFVLNGTVTGNGPTTPAERYAWLNAGHRPYTITLPGGQTISYNKVEPMGMTLGALADTVEMARYTHEDDTSALISSLVLGFGHAMLSKTYMEQWSNFIDAMSDPNKQGTKFLDNFAASFAVPGIVSGVDRMFDEFMRSHQGLMETIASRTPGLSNQMPPTRDVWGDPVERPGGILGGVGRAFSPFDLSPAKDVNPIDKFFWDNRQYAPEAEQGRIGASPPPRTLHVNVGGKQQLQIPLNSQDYDRLRVSAGNGYKMDYGGTMYGAKEALNALVSGQLADKGLQAEFNAASPSQQYLMALSIQATYKKAATDDFIQHDAGISSKIAAGRATRGIELAAPTMGASP